MRQLELLEDENNPLKNIYADLKLDREMFQDVIRRKHIRARRLDRSGCRDRNFFQFGVLPRDDRVAFERLRRNSDLPEGLETR